MEIGEKMEVKEIRFLLRGGYKFLIVLVFT